MSKKNRALDVPTNLQLEFQNELELFRNFATSLFMWENLPTGLKSRIVEGWLLDHPVIAGFNTTEFGVVILPATHTALNLYYEPTNFRPIRTAYEGISINYNQDEVVPCFDNNIRAKIWDNIVSYVWKMINIRHTINMVCNQLRLPYIIRASKSQVPTLNAIFTDISLGKEHILTHDSIDIKELVEILNLNVDGGNISVLWDAYYKLKAEALAILGIPYYPPSSSAKKANLIKDEINRDDIITSAMSNLRLQQRLDFCEEYNATFNPEKPLSVKLRYPIETHSNLLDDDVIDVRNELNPLENRNVETPTAERNE